jgi:hypothetical protein
MVLLSGKVQTQYINQYNSNLIQLKKNDIINISKINLSEILINENGTINSENENINISSIERKIYIDETYEKNKNENK